MDIGTPYRALIGTRKRRALESEVFFCGRDCQRQAWRDAKSKAGHGEIYLQSGRPCLEAQ